MTPSRLFYRLCVGVVGELLCLGLMTRHGDFLHHGEPLAFVAVAFVAGAAFWLAVDAFARVLFAPRTGARWFWVVAVACRVVMLPILPGDDLWRYRWEGAIQLHGFNPYVLAPDAPALTPLRDAEWTRISHQSFPAIYPPLAELTFAAIAWSKMPVLGYKILFALADLGIAGILRRLLARRGRPAEAVWYAWNPLAVYVSAGAAHFDCLMVLALMGAVCCLDQLPARPPPGWRVPMAAWASVGLLGAAVALKMVPALLLPVWSFALGWRRALLALPVAAGGPVALAFLYGFPGTPVFGALDRFARDFRVNDALWWLVDPASHASGAARFVTIGVCGVLAAWWRADWRRALLWVMGAVLLLGPQVHAWYVLWILPLAVWRGARAWCVLSVSMFGYFLLWEVNHASSSPWTEPLWLRVLIYGPPLAALAWPTVLRPSAQANPAETCYPYGIQPMNPSRASGWQADRAGRAVLVLPACHEEQTIGPVLDELHALLDPSEGWTVAVGVNGSPPGADRTALLARRHPLRPLVAETPARGYGHGCQAAIDLVETLGLAPDAYVFFAADGANDPRNLPALLAARRAGYDFVLGCRTSGRSGEENRRVMGWSHLLANRLLGAWCGWLARRTFHDIGPLRLIERNLFHRLGMREWTFGWTVEAQITAARLGAAMVEIPVCERPRLAGEQKVSKVNWRQTLFIGWQIALAGWRTRRRDLAPDAPAEPASQTRPSQPAVETANVR